MFSYIILFIIFFSSFSSALPLNRFGLQYYYSDRCYYINKEVRVDDVKYTTNWFQASDGNYYLFSTDKNSDAVMSSLTLKFDFDVPINENEKKQVISLTCTNNNGDSNSFNICNLDYVGTDADGCTSTDTFLSYSFCKYIDEDDDNKEYSFYIKKSKDSWFHLQINKELSVINENRSTETNGFGTISCYSHKNVDESLKKFKGRGNSSWSLSDKKPYNVNFEEKFNNNADLKNFKKCALISNDLDESLMRNFFAYQISSKLFDTTNYRAYTPFCRPTELVINNDYLGSYLFCTRVEKNMFYSFGFYNKIIKNDNLEFCDADKSCAKSLQGFDPNDPDNTNLVSVDGSIKGSRKFVNDKSLSDVVETSGYILEFELTDRYNDEVTGFTTNLGQNVVIKYPEYATRNQVNYLADLFQALEVIVYSDSDCKPGCNQEANKCCISDYINTESFVNMYILHELTMCTDSGLTSTFFFIVDGKIYAGSAWDFDAALGNNRFKDNFHNCIDPNLWYANTNFKPLSYYGSNVLPTIFSALYKHKSFRNAVFERWNSLNEDPNFFTSLKN